MLRRSLRTRITTRVLVLSAAVAVLLGATLVLLIIAVTGQRDAARTAFRSQKALTADEPPRDDAAGDRERPARLRRAATRSARSKPVTEPARRLPDAAARGRRGGLRRPRPARSRAPRSAARSTTTSARRAAAARSRRDSPQAAPSNQLFYTTNRERVDGARRRPARARRPRAHARQRARGRRRGAVVARDRRSGSAASCSSSSSSSAARCTCAAAVVRPVVSVARRDRPARGRRPLDPRARRSREDEIGDLARGFNSMADSLERGQAELERSNAELKRSNAELEQFASVTLARPAGAADDDLDVRRAARAPPRRRAPTAVTTSSTASAARRSRRAR